MSSGSPASSTEDGTTPTDIEHRFIAFVRAFGLHKPEETPCGAPLPLSEAHAVSVLAELGPLPQMELARHLELTKSTVSRLVGQLVDKGWATREPAADDARRRLVQLTSAGRKLAEQIDGQRRQRLAQLLERVPESERDAVLQALETLTRAARDTPDR